MSKKYKKLFNFLYLIIPFFKKTRLENIQLKKENSELLAKLEQKQEHINATNRYYKNKMYKKSNKNKP